MLHSPFSLKNKMKYNWLILVDRKSNTNNESQYLGPTKSREMPNAGKFSDFRPNWPEFFIALRRFRRHFLHCCLIPTVHFSISLSHSLSFLLASTHTPLPPLLFPLSPATMTTSHNSTMSGCIGGEIDTGDTTWVLISTILVMGMLPALAFFEAGLLRSKNTLSLITQIIGGFITLTVMWDLFGYSLTFSTDR